MRRIDEFRKLYIYFEHVFSNWKNHVDRINIINHKFYKIFTLTFIIMD